MAVDYFLKIKDIPGESKIKGHEDEIQIESWSWGETNQGSSAQGGGGGAGKVVMQDFSFVMSVNKASPKIFQYCATGKVIPEILLVCRKQGGAQEEYLKMTFTNSVVSSYQTQGGEESVRPRESVEINFSKIEFSYAPQKDDGTLEAFETHWYDLKTSECE